MSNFLFYSWNVNGIRAQEKKGFCNWAKSTNADIIAVQETKANPSQLSEQLLHLNGYQSYWKFGEKKGYSGVAIYSRIKPINIIDHFQEQTLDSEGRLIGLEFEKFFFFNGYFPNGGQGIHRVQYKLDFYNLFYEYISQLKKPVIFCGDINTAHNEIDLAHPNANHNTSGFMDIERKWLNFILDEKNWIDTFRYYNKNAYQYTWWDMKTKARDRNIGWRLDYFIASPGFEKHLISSKIHHQVMGSDHAPISLTIKI